MTEAEEKRLRGIEEAADRVRLVACGVVFPTPGYTSLLDALGRLHKALAPVEPEALTKEEVSFLGGHTGASGIPCCVSPICHGSWMKAAARLRFLEAERAGRQR